MKDTSWLAIAFIIVFFLITMSIGIYASRTYRTDTTSEFLTGGGGVNWWVNGIAMFAAFASGGTMLGALGLSYTAGWGYSTANNAGVAMGYLITSYFLATVMRNMNVATVPEFIKARFPSRVLSIMVPLVFIFAISAYVIAQMKVGGLIGERVLGVHYKEAVILIGAVYVFYTFIGGMKAVTLTDYAQGLLMISVLMCVGAIALTMNDGPLNTYTLATELRAKWAAGDEAGQFPFIAYVGGFLVWATVNAVLPHTVMRIFAAKNERVGRGSLLLGVGLYVATALTTAIAIVGATVVITGGVDLAKPDETFLIFLEHVPNWLAALAFAGIFAAVMSSVSAMLLGLSAAFSYDLVGYLRPNMSDGAGRRLTRWSILIFGVATLVLALNPPRLLALFFSIAMGLLSSALFAPLLLGVWWKRMNTSGATAGALAGAIVYLTLLFGADMPPLSEMIYSLPASLIVAVATALLTKPPTDAEMFRISIAHEREYTEEDAAEYEKRFGAPAAG